MNAAEKSRFRALQVRVQQAREETAQLRADNIVLRLERDQLRSSLAACGCEPDRVVSEAPAPSDTPGIELVGRVADIRGIR